MKTIQTKSPTLDQIWNRLEEVVDPEIPVISVVDLGIVRGVRWCQDQGEPKLIVTITPTYSGCPATSVIKKDIVTALSERGINNVQIETQLAPAWTTDWLSEKGKGCLREYGIAPPRRLHRDLEETLTNSASVLEQAVSGSLRSRCSVNHTEANDAIDCPLCGSKNIRMVSQFGSTPCKALYVCDACREPFDYFKCH
jgi:ring-1,2-phenylacetyl-CoA epoxidase subunit PaaD